MRTEHQMMALIRNQAINDERIRAVILNGSRANPDAPRDCFQDYDIVYVTREVVTFTSDHRWIDVFGERLILQMPDLTDIGNGKPTLSNQQFTYLMLFKDGNRIDLTLMTPERATDYINGDSLSIILLDKDQQFNAVPPSDDRDYRIISPSKQQFADCCNELWWVAPYVAKGLWRGEIPYAKAMLEQPVRDMMLRMLSWYAGVRTGFTISAGKCGKYLPRYVDADVWQDYLSTYPDADSEHVWQALFRMCALFRRLARHVADHFGYDYAEADDRNVTNYLHHVHALPREEKVFD
ncbi:aminoglycoside 6-adenylyltransferase [Sporolactobacillus inulinus]|uniref:Aminoglycoside 6-adenylyltransferase n=2 Tax=Sporolactobacillus inulinus TaxID=2078 RepID=A0A4Y1Z722_9BACL|nr:aminoglycoside 6-adenylyltransferase [Sporolactobacillus inulinus]KLI01428.1 aminoglycoside adenylyltransferase [Sporolactobacillus inulinus CASD]GAY74784.1 aminoglycoside 6-adenylyltransferase [Sporolactobacillus inulinus]GEB77916.1 aminoglycoside 6-adenylyltransferase [Sporolactobacillus inulinus]